MDITEFQNEHRWLSNFHPCPVTLDGLHFESVEAAYVAAKTLDESIRKQVQALRTPGACKRYGRSIELRFDWPKVKLHIMGKLLRQKFAPGTGLSQKLTETGDCQLVEGNHWGDEYWGVCRGKGSNNLGKLLMEIRRELIAANEKQSNPTSPPKVTV